MVMANGKNHHVAFSPLTGGGSVFYTDIPELQAALEAHYKFGKLFKTDLSYPEEKVQTRKGKRPQADPVPEEPTQPTGMTGAGQEVEEATGEDSNVIVVTDPDEAKDYLCARYGLSRTKIKGIQAIKDAAAVNGITFKGLD